MPRVKTRIHCRIASAARGLTCIKDHLVASFTHSIQVLCLTPIPRATQGDLTQGLPYPVLEVGYSSAKGWRVVSVHHLSLGTQADRVPHAVCFQPVVPNDAVPA